MPLDFRPKYEKIVELLLYLAHKKPGVDKYQVVKLFYLADKEHLNRHGRPITQEKYFALPYGPVASTAKELMERNFYTLKRANLESLPFEVEVRKRPGKEPLLVIGPPKREVDYDLFSKSDLRVIDEVIEKYGEFDFDALYQLTHRHEAYRRAWDNRPRDAKAAPMLYEEMIDSRGRRDEILEDIGPISSRM